MLNDFELKHFNALTTKELYDIIAIRLNTFAFEQQIGYEDTDYKDINAYHLFLYKNNEMIAYCRLLEKGVAYKDAPSIGRVCVKKKFRTEGIGKELVKEAIKQINTLWHPNIIKISAQYYLVPFYIQLGFEIESGLYDEDGLPHQKMKLVNN